MYVHLPQSIAKYIGKEQIKHNPKKEIPPIFFLKISILFLSLNRINKGK